MGANTSLSPGSIAILGVVAVSAAVPVSQGDYVLGIHLVAVATFGAWVPIVARVRALAALWISAGLWAVAQVLSNYLLGGDMGAAVGYVGLLTALVVTFLYSLSRYDNVRIPDLIVALSLGWIGFLIVSRGELFDVNPWKYGLATPAALLAFAVLWRLRAGIASCAVMIVGFVVLSVVNESRFFAVSGVAVVLWLVLQPIVSKRPGRSLIAAVTISAALFALYPTVAANGLLGDRAQSDQQRLEAVGANFLVTNRPEVLQSARLTMAHPLLGVGSRGSVPPGEAVETVRWLQRLGVENSAEKTAYLLDSYNTNQGYSPHSSMFVSSIQAGLLALPYWVLCILLVCRAALSGQTTGPAHRTLLAFLAIQTVWNAFFSPLGATTYLTVIAAVLVALPQDLQSDTAAVQPRDVTRPVSV